MDHERRMKLENYKHEMDLWMIRIRSPFHEIDDDDELISAEDKKRLKEYCLNECVIPRIREAVKSTFPENSPPVKAPAKTNPKQHDRPH